MAGVKGKSGRKPNERFFRNALLDSLDRPDETDSTRTRFERVVEKLVELANDGDIQAIREIMDRVDGKPKQTNEHSGPDGEAIPLSVTVRWK